MFISTGTGLRFGPRAYRRKRYYPKPSTRRRHGRVRYGQHGGHGGGGGGGGGDPDPGDPDAFFYITEDSQFVYTTEAGDPLIQE